MQAENRDTMPHPSAAPDTHPEHAPRKYVYASGSQPLAGYTIKRGVGAGGFGEIYYAVSDAGKQVALKLIQRHLDVELRGIRQCLNLKHPNLVALYDVKQDPHENWWVVMEYIAGQNLEQTLAGYPHGLPVPQALLWIHGIGAGVGYLHDRGIVHRDLKPGNIFCDEGLIKIGDYGLSKFISCSRRSGHTESIGTVHYMAPEVANGRYGKEIDIYAMGIILYEMLTGRVPFEGESVGEVLMKHLTAEPDVRMLAEPYRSVVARALHKDPGKRFASVGQMLAALPVVPGAGYAAGATSGGAPEVGVPQGEPVITAALVEEADEEPLWRMGRQNVRRMRNQWDEWAAPRPIKTIALVLLILVLLHAGPLWMPLAFVGALFYGMYWVARVLVLAIAPPPRRPPAAWYGVKPPVPQALAATPAGPAVAGGHPPTPAAKSPFRPNSWRATAMRELAARPGRLRLTELVGSMFLGALVAGVMSLVALILNGYWSGSLPQPEQVGWMIVMCLAGTWAVQIVAKFWEGRADDILPRRFVMMVVGLGLGLLAWHTAQFLEVGLAESPSLPPALHAGPLTVYPGLIAADGTPRMLGFVASFGALFLLTRWWRQADPLRRRRLTLGPVIGSALVAYLVGWLGLFPHPWMILVAGMISVSVQMSSPWLEMPSKAAA